MCLRRIFSALAVIVAMATTWTVVKAQSTDLNGTWDAVLSSGSSPREKERYTFTPGRTSDDGGVIFSNEEESPGCTTDQGVWERTDTRTFILTHGAFCDGDTTVKWREEITLGPRGEGFSGRGVEERSDALGTFFIRIYTLRGTRMHSEAPPP